MTAPSLSLVIPCYNEAANLPLLFQRIETLIRKLPDAEIILVDNGSTDGSASSFRILLAAASPALAAAVRMTRVETNVGYGHGILSGLALARGEYLAWTHADLQTDLEDVARAYERQSQGAGSDRIMVKGKRIGRNALDAAFTMGMSALSSLALGMPARDVNAQPKVFPRSLYQAFSAAPTDFSLDLYLLWLARKQGYRIETVPVRFARRQHGEAKGGGSWQGKLALAKRTFRYIFELRSRLQTMMVAS